MAAVWRERIDGDWTPGAGDISGATSAFPWRMVRVSLEALLPGMEDASGWLARAAAGLPAGVLGPRRVAHVLAGNTPLLAWPGLAACLLAGSHSVVKMSRDETLWPRRFVESLALVDADLAATISLDVWPGDDPRTLALVRSTDAVIAYGGDAALAALRAAPPSGTPFFGFGHALSVGVVPKGGGAAAAFGFARDVLLYDQGGCLSPHAVLVEGDGARAADVGTVLAAALAAEAEALAVPAVDDPGVARTVREARDLTLFEPGVTVCGDPALRWTVIVRPRAEPLTEAPVGHGVVTVAPVGDLAAEFGGLLGAARGRVSSVGVAGGTVAEPLRRVLEREGVTRICAAGTMQCPPLDWPNGGRDLLADLLRAG
jgi:hypothetical protein